jgi:hypothetical protein
MTRLSTLGRTLAIATVVAGVLMFALAVQGVTRVDTKLELAAAGMEQKAATKYVDCPFQPRKQQHRERQRI